jgi:hypothetical protein
LSAQIYETKRKQQQKIKQKRKKIMTLLTPYQKERQRKRNEIYAEYKRLAENPSNMPSAIIQYLMGKYNIGAASTIYGIIKEKETSNENN